MNRTTGTEANTSRGEAPEHLPVDVGLHVDLDDPKDYAEIARKFISNSRSRRLAYIEGEWIPLVVWWAGEWWEYDDELQAHVVRDEKDYMRIIVREFLNCCHYRHKNQTFKFNPTIGKVSEALDALREHVGKQTMQSVTPPVWLHRRRDSRLPDLRGCIVFRNALLRIDGSRFSPHPKSPALFAPHVVPYDYDPNPPEPYHWLAWLENRFQHDPGQMATLQEWFGYCLTSDTSMHKALYVHGPARSGKSTLARVLEAVVGSHNVTSPSIKLLTGSFGLAGLIGKPLAIMADAKFAVRDSVVAVERLKAITGEDNVSVERKHREEWHGKLPTRFVIVSNDQLDLRDDSAALARRMLSITMPDSFYGNEDPSIERDILDELPGIVGWALQGLVRLRREGRFTQTAAAIEARERLQHAGSPLSEFVEARLELGDRGDPLTSDEVWHEYREWCGDEGLMPKPKPVFVRELVVAEPRIKALRRNVKRADGTRTKVGVLEGIRTLARDPGAGHARL